MIHPKPQSDGVIVVGVVHEQSDAVLREVVALAQRLKVRVLAGHVDTTRYFTSEHPDGSVESISVNSEIYDIQPSPFPEEIRARFERVFAGTGVEWDVRELAGDPASALGRLAERFDAELIVVGTRRPGFRGAVGEFLAGSVATHLAHRQRRPVLVIPQSPDASGTLPWQDE